uniref:Uncharacterized protein n=1 Tax=Romanomermis culicivorax TaxID=13658 RepID=A0A915L4K9_ROMCU
MLKIRWYDKQVKASVNDEGEQRLLIIVQSDYHFYKSSYARVNQERDFEFFEAFCTKETISVQLYDSVGFTWELFSNFAKVGFSRINSDTKFKTAQAKGDVSNKANCSRRLRKA